MAYELRTGETLGNGVSRVCRRQIALALEVSRSVRTETNSPVHGTRKHLKKARAALCLLGGAVSRKKYDRAKAKLRKVAHLISDVRDAEVRYETVRQLGRLLEMEDHHLMQEAEAFLGLELESFLAAFADWQQDAERHLNVVRRRMKAWPLHDLTCGQIRRTVQATYQRGRKSLAQALETPTAANFHTFRRRAKELMYQLRILHPLHPVLFEQLVSELEVLTENLGASHDLSFLEKRLIQHSRRGVDDHAAEAFSELIGLREKQLQRTAAALGERFYAERPKNFARRISEYFEQWQSGHPDESAALAEVRSLLVLNGT